MSNLDALLETSATSESGMKPCVIGRHIIDLPEPYGPAVKAILTNTELSADLVSYKLKSAGLRGSVRTIQIHRRAICGCPAEVYA